MRAPLFCDLSLLAEAGLLPCPEQREGFLSSGHHHMDTSTGIQYKRFEPAKVTRQVAVSSGLFSLQSFRLLLGPPKGFEIRPDVLYALLVQDLDDRLFALRRIDR